MLAGPRSAEIAHRHARLRVVDFAVRRRVVPCSVARAAEVEGELAIADVDVAGTAGGAAIAAEIEGQVAGSAVLRLRRNLIRNHVDHAAQRAGAVEQRGGAAHHFNPARRRRVGRHAVIARLARQVAHPLAVLEHRDAIAIQAANDGTRGTRTKFTKCDTGRLGQRRANGGFQVLRQLLSGKH